MRKLIFLIAICICLFGCNNSNNNYSTNIYSYENFGLICPVKSFKEIEYNSQYGTIKKGSINSLYTADFNKLGALSSVKEYNEDLYHLYSVTNFKYNNDGKILSITDTLENGELNYSRIFYYDESGLLVKSETNIPPIGDLTISIYIYSENDLKKIIYKSYNKEIAKEIYSHKNHESIESIYYSLDSLQEKYQKKIKLNKSGKVVKYLAKNISAEITRNEMNLPTHMKNAVFCSLYGLFESGMDIEIAYNQDEEIYIEYEYDTKGNWIKRFVYEGETKLCKTITEREIIY